MMAACKAHRGQCPTCRQNVGPSDIQHECGGRSHAWCLDPDMPNFKQCAACAGDVDMTQLNVDQPISLDGVNYIDNPAQMPTKSMFASFFNTKQTIESSTQPHFLLSHGPKTCPIDWMITSKGIAMQQMCKAGVRMEDFVMNGYSWKDLQFYDDLNGKRGDSWKMKTLKALGTNAEHFRDYQFALPMDQMKIAPRDLVEHFGLYFKPNCGPLVVEGGQNKKLWTARDLVHLGFSVNDLFGAHMEYLNQYAALEPSDEDEERLGITDADLDDLKTLKSEHEHQIQKQILEEQIHRTRPFRNPVPRDLAVNEPVTADKTSPPVRKTHLHGLRKKKRQ